MASTLHLLNALLHTPADSWYGLRNKTEISKIKTKAMILFFLTLFKFFILLPPFASNRANSMPEMKNSKKLFNLLILIEIQKLGLKYNIKMET